MSEDSTPSIASGVGVFFVRLFLGGIGFVVVLALAMLSGIPYGGGSSALFLLAWGVLIATPAWALAPLIRAAFHRRNAPDDSGT